MALRLDILVKAQFRSLKLNKEIWALPIKNLIWLEYSDLRHQIDMIWITLTLNLDVDFPSGKMDKSSHTRSKQYLYQF